MRQLFWNKKEEVAMSTRNDNFGGRSNAGFHW
jgi:hypothetical protein